MVVWTLTPGQRSELHVSTPSGLQHPFGCLRPAQGSIAGYLVSPSRLEALSDPCPHLLRGCGNSVSLRLRASKTLRLAVKMNSLARDSKRITPPCVSVPRRRHPCGHQSSGAGPFRAVYACNHLVSGSFNTSSEVLFSFPSRYYCAIGLG